MTQQDVALTRTVAGQLVPAVGRWTFAAGDSEITFTAKHLVVSKVRGSFRKFSGQIDVAEEPAASTVQVDIAAASIDTGLAFRDKDLRGPEFLDADNHPSMTFRSTAVRQDGDGWVLAGDLTMAGKTHGVDLQMSFGGVVSDGWHTLALFEASTEITRDEWGMTYNKALESGGVLIGSKVKIEIDVKASRAKED